jgi:hypothetical protein
MAKKESAAAFLRRVAGIENDKEAREWIEETLQKAQLQHLAMSNMGTITVIVVPGGAFGWHISDNLMSRVALDSVDKALNDVQEDVITIRRRITDKELEVTSRQAAEQIVEDQEQEEV